MMNRMEAFETLEPVDGTFEKGPKISKNSQNSELDLAAVWEAYAVSRDENLRNRLLLHYMPLSQMIARHMHARLPQAVDLDDLAQAAVLGMRAAIKSYDPARGVPFDHYCGPRVRGAVLDHLRSLDWAPRMLRSRVNRVQEMTRQIEMERGVTATDEQVSSALNLPVSEVHSLRGEMAAPVRLRLTSSDEDSSYGVNLDSLPDRGLCDPLREAQKSDLREFLIKGLSSVERQIVILYYYDSMSLREIGETLNLCESRVSQIHLAVIKRLRERMHRIGGVSVED